MSIPRRRHVFRLQRTLYTVQGTATRHGVEDAAHHSDLLLVHNVVIAGLVIFKAVVSPRVADKPTLLSFLQSSPSGPLGGLSALELGELVQNTIGELSFRGIVAPVVQRLELAAVPLELPAEQVVVCWLSGEAFSVLCQYHRDATSSHEIPHSVQPWSREARSTLAGIGYLL